MSAILIGRPKQEHDIRLQLDRSNVQRQCIKHRRESDLAALHSKNSNTAITQSKSQPFLWLLWGVQGTLGD